MYTSAFVRRAFSHPVSMSELIISLRAYNRNDAIYHQTRNDRSNPRYTESQACVPQSRVDRDGSSVDPLLLS
jgi:hypothetical protein